MFGTGTGAFTDGTSATPYPNLAAMLAYAQQVGQTAPTATLPAATAAFCGTLENGICTGHCEGAVEEVWLKKTGQYPNPYAVPPTGASAWEVLTAAGRAHPGDRSPPIGALLFYTQPNDANGHVAVYLGGNMVFSTDVLGNGSVYITSADSIEKTHWSMQYIGWADPYSTKAGGLW